MFVPFSRRARPWERHGRTLRRLASIADEALLDPWKLAPKVGLTVMDGEVALALLSPEVRRYLCGLASRSWSGGVWPSPLPDGTRLCILNPKHNARRNKVTLMEEIAHNFLGHRPTRITLNIAGLEVRAYNASEEAEAYGVGAAALIPWATLFGLLNRGMDIGQIATRFDVSEDLATYRIKITGAYKLYQARRPRSA